MIENLTKAVNVSRREFAAEYLRSKQEWAGPTEVGVAFGLDYSQASSGMMSALRTLVSRGDVETHKGKYRWVRRV